MEMWYQGGTNYLKASYNITPALQTGDRPEVWFEIRYGSSKNGRDGNGVVILRFFESGYFGLYELGTGPGNISDSEAMAAR